MIPTTFHQILRRIPKVSRSSSFPWTVVLVLFPTGAWLDAELLLVKEGQPRSTIVMGAKASPKERLAAEELRAYLHKISGAFVPLITDADNASGTRILVGRNCFSAAQDFRTTDLELDGYLIEVRSTDLVLLGDTDQGSMNAVYGLLEDHLQVAPRWFHARRGVGEDVLPQRTIRFPALQERRKADFFCSERTDLVRAYQGSTGLAAAQPRLPRHVQLFLRAQLS